MEVSITVEYSQRFLVDWRERYLKRKTKFLFPDRKIIDPSVSDAIVKKFKAIIEANTDANNIKGKLFNLIWNGIFLIILSIKSLTGDANINIQPIYSKLQNPYYPYFEEHLYHPATTESLEDALLEDKRLRIRELVLKRIKIMENNKKHAIEQKTEKNQEENYLYKNTVTKIPEKESKVNMMNFVGVETKNLNPDTSPFNLSVIPLVKGNEINLTLNINIPNTTLRYNNEIPILVHDYNPDTVKPETDNVNLKPQTDSQPVILEYTNSYNIAVDFDGISPDPRQLFDLSETVSQGQVTDWIHGTVSQLQTIANSEQNMRAMEVTSTTENAEQKRLKNKKMFEKIREEFYARHSHRKRPRKARP